MGPPPPPPAQRRLRRALSSKQREAAAQKLMTLTGKVQFVPFTGNRSGFALHEPLLRSLGLWDFATLDLGSPPLDASLVASLVAYYDPRMHRSFVRDVRIAVSRAELAKALCLPLRKVEQPPLPPGSDGLSVLGELMSRFVLFPFEEEACILPTEVAAATEMLRQGDAGMVDWAGLVWGLVEKEILDLERSGICYYAPHLQRLIWCQRPELFDSTKFGESQTGEENELSEPVVDGDAEDEGGVDERGLEDLINDEEEGQEEGAEEELINGEEKREGEDEEEEDGEEMDEEEEEDGEEEDGEEEDGDEEDEETEEAAEDADPGSELGTGDDDDGDGNGNDDANKEGDIEQSGHCFQRCGSLDLGVEFEGLAKEDVEMQALHGRFDERYGGKMVSFDRLGSSADLMQSMSTMHMPYASSLEDLHAANDFLAMNQGTHKSVAVGSGASIFLSPNRGKRHVVGDDQDGADDDANHQHNNLLKRMRVDGACEIGSASFNSAVVEPIRSALAKGSMLLASKDQELMDAQMELQYLKRLVQEKDQVIHSLENGGLEQQRKWQLELCRFQHELNVMAQLVIGYKRALKQTNASFSEYRKKFPQGEKPLYCDVPDSGGLVVSVKEFEKQRLEKEEQTRAAICAIVDKFRTEWFLKLDGYTESLLEAQRRTDSIGKEVSFLRERLAKKVETSEIVPDSDE